MTLEAELFALLSPIVAGRVFPDVAPNGTIAPYATYQQVGGEVINYLGREVPDLHHARVQINVWCATRMQASMLARQIEDAFRTATAFQASPLGAPVSRAPEESPLYGAMQDFSIWN